MFIFKKKKFTRKYITLICYVSIPHRFVAPADIYALKKACNKSEPKHGIFFRHSCFQIQSKDSSKHVLLQAFTSVQKRTEKEKKINMRQNKMLQNFFRYKKKEVLYTVQRILIKF